VGVLVFKNLIRSYIALAMATKGRLPPTALWNPPAHPRITLSPQVKNCYERKRDEIPPCKSIAFCGIHATHYSATFYFRV
jgi:hypothetical protein